MEVPQVTSVRVVGDHQVDIEFSDGVHGCVDLLDELVGPIFEPLHDPAAFRLVFVDPEAGTIVWPNGADIAPETLYDLARGEEPGAWWAMALAEFEERKAGKKRASA